MNQTASGTALCDPTDLWSDGYVVVPDVITEASAQRLAEYIRRLNQHGLGSDVQVPGASAKYADPTMDRLLEALVPRMEQVTGRRLYPTYSYFRIYRPRDTLAKHTDRAACEISLSLCLECRPPNSWPLCIKGLRQVVTAAALEPGAGVVYLGCQCTHWRDPFEGESAVQVFLHYVDQAGRYRDWKYDKRNALSHHGQPQHH